MMATVSDSACTHEDIGVSSTSGGKQVANAFLGFQRRVAQR